MDELTNIQQYLRVIYLGICFLVVFASVGSFRNIASKIYDEYGFKNMGQIALLIQFIISALFCLSSSYIIKKLGYQKSMMISGLSHLGSILFCLIIGTGMPIPDSLKWLMVIVGAVLQGFGSTIVYTASGSYISKVSSSENKNQLFSLFWGLKQTGNLVGNIIIILVLGKTNNFTYLVLATAFVTIGSLMFLFLPHQYLNENQHDSRDPQAVSIQQEANKALDILKDRRYHNLKLYYFLPGVSMAFTFGFLYKLVEGCLSQEYGEKTEDYNHRIDYNLGFVLLTQSAGSTLTGFLMNRFSKTFNTFKLPIVGVLIAEIAALLSLACSISKALPLCFLVGLLNGISFNYMLSNTGALTSKIFPGKVEAYSVLEIMLFLGTSIFLLLTVALSSFPNQICLVILIILQLVMLRVVWKIQELEPNGERQELADDEQMN